MYVDLHVHLRGTMSAATARRLAVRNGIALPESLLAAPGYGWTDFSSFLQAYDEVASVVATAVDLQEVAYNYLMSAASEGTGYVEFMLSTPHEGRTGAPFGDQLVATTPQLTGRWKRRVSNAGSSPLRSAISAPRPRRWPQGRLLAGAAAVW